MKRVCKQCGKEFELSEGELRFTKRKGLDLPKRCQQCREQKTGNRPKRTVAAAAVVLLFLVSFWENILRQTFLTQHRRHRRAQSLKARMRQRHERTYEFPETPLSYRAFRKHGDEFPYDTEEAYLQRRQQRD